jgi:FixJ family two-component response regulator
VAAKRELPIIFITGHGDIPMTVQAMKGGAIEFLTKPFRDQDLLDAIHLGLSRDRASQNNKKVLAALKERFGSLSPRERDIMLQVMQGRLSKQIAGDMGIAEATVKVHRSRAMRKMRVRSLPELGRMADKLKLGPDEPQHF